MPNIQIQGNPFDVIETGYIKQCVAMAQTTVNSLFNKIGIIIGESGTGKTIKFTSGKVSWRDGKESLAIDEEDKLVETLKRLKLGQYLNMKVTPDKTALAKASPALQLRLGIHKERGSETLTLTPNNGEKIELK